MSDIQPTRKAKVCLFGGTFDPIHLGHTKIAEMCHRLLGMDKIIFLPCSRSPHKMQKHSALDHHRLNMCQLATATLPWAEVHDHDLTTPAPNYSWKTAEFFRQLYPDAELFWLMGTDQWHSIDSWNRHEHLNSLVHFIVVTRGESAKKHPSYPHIEIEAQHPASATQVRNAISSGRIPWWIDHDVLAYIERHSLYHLR